MDSLTLRKLESKYTGDPVIFDKMVKYKANLQEALRFTLTREDIDKLQNCIRNESLISKLLILVNHYQNDLNITEDTTYALTKSASVILSELDMPEYSTHHGHLDFYNKYTEYLNSSKKIRLDILDIQDKLILLNIIPEISIRTQAIDWFQIELFTSEKIEFLFKNFSKDYVQLYVDDNIIDNNRTNYLTSIIEVGSVISLSHNQLGNITNEQLFDYSLMLACGYNIFLAKKLKKKGIVNIPLIEDGSINLYFTGNAIKEISERIVYHISLAYSNKKIHHDLYFNGLLIKNFKL